MEYYTVIYNECTTDKYNCYTDIMLNKSDGHQRLHTYSVILFTCSQKTEKIVIGVRRMLTSGWGYWLGKKMKEFYWNVLYLDLVGSLTSAYVY